MSRDQPVPIAEARHGR